jgi:Asp-tRNA(Asn)/Glu-tRNA(Gln) amidotransferase A subunit family amidase
VRTVPVQRMPALEREGVSIAGGSSNATIGELSERIRTKESSPVDVVRACLARIDKLNPRLNAFITVLADEALQEAKTAEAQIRAGQWRGPLHGVPVGIKDMFDTAGIRTTAAFEHFRNRIPSKDAEAVRKLKEAGAIIIGKTNLHKLAMGTTTLPADHPADPQRRSPRGCASPPSTPTPSGRAVSPPQAAV